MKLSIVTTTNRILAIAALPLEISKEHWGSRSRIIYSGIGKINASIILTEAVNVYKPDLVVNLGTVGSLHSDITGVVEVNSVIERDFDAYPLRERGLIPFEEGDNRFCSGYEGVLCASGDSFVREPDIFLKQMKVDVVDMELIAIARVCNKYKIPWRSFKFVSDYIGSNIEQEWQNSVTRASYALIEKFDSELL